MDHSVHATKSSGDCSTWLQEKLGYKTRLFLCLFCPSACGKGVFTLGDTVVFGADVKYHHWAQR